MRSLVGSTPALFRQFSCHFGPKSPPDVLGCIPPSTIDLHPVHGFGLKTLQSGNGSKLGANHGWVLCLCQRFALCIDKAPIVFGWHRGEAHQP